MKIYTAGPLGFSEAGRNFHYATVLPALRQLGHEVLDPWILTDPTKILAVTNLPYGPDKREAWKLLNAEIGRNNVAAIDQCDAVFVVLDGPDVDSGSAAEVGYAFAKGKPIVGYRSDFRLSADNEGSIINLQVEYFIRASGGNIISKITDVALAMSALKLN